MTFWVYSGGHDMQLRLNIDSLGQLYVGLAAAWTVILAAGILFLIANRKSQCLRIRNLTLAIGAVCILHVYWVLSMLAYVLNGYFHCATEFWVMSLYLPLGIALYQANSTQLLYIATLQHRFAGSDSAWIRHRVDLKSRRWRKILVKWRSCNMRDRTMVVIGLGMVIQGSEMP
jgi:hypothetical protein